MFKSFGKKDDTPGRNVRVITHSSIRIEASTGVIYADPYNLQLKKEPHDADYILITHGHYDHFSPDDIAKVIKGTTAIVAPAAMREQVENVYGGRGNALHFIVPGESADVAGLHIETIPAYNIGKEFHPKEAGGVGYILDVDGSRIFIAGDTDKTPENSAVRCDIALVPVGGKYTMDARKAADLINEMKPAVAIPTHYGSVVGTDTDANFFKTLVRPPVVVQKKY